MTSKNSLLTYHDGRLAQIAAIYGDYRESLCLIEKFSIRQTLPPGGISAVVTTKQTGQALASSWQNTAKPQKTMTLTGCSLMPIVTGQTRSTQCP